MNPRMLQLKLASFTDEVSPGKKENA